jgi:peroxiredoxin
VGTDDAILVANRLLGTPLPSIRLESTVGDVDLADFAGDLLVLFVYPHATGLPDAPVPGWDLIPGARGCTAQSCAFRDQHGRFSELGARLVGLSVQTVQEQVEFAARVGVHYPLVSDPSLKMSAALALPTFTSGGRTFYKRLAFVAKWGRIVKIFYPVPSPEQNAADVLQWLENGG